VRVTVEADGRRRDIEIDAAAGATGEQVEAAIRRDLGLDDGADLTSSRTGLAFGVDGANAVLDGDVVVAGAGRRSGRRADAYLVVSAGPSMGLRIPVTSDVTTIGRDPSCDATLNDPSVSGLHLRARFASGKVELQDAGSSNGSFIDRHAVPIDGWATLRPDELLEIGRSVLQREPPRPTLTQVPMRSGSTLSFTRQPRVTRPETDAHHALEAPPAEPQRTRLPIAASLLPLVVGVALWQITGNVTMLAFTALSPVLALGTFIESRRAGRSTYRKGERAFRAAVAEQSDRLEAAVANEERERRDNSPDVLTLIGMATDCDPRLWERRPIDDDFLALRLGLADQAARTTVSVEAGGSEHLRTEAAEQFGDANTAHAVPVVLGLATEGPLGVTGPRERVDALGRWLVAQAAGLHSPRDVVIAAAVGDQAYDDWEWLKWLPHTRPEAAGEEWPLLAVGEHASRQLWENLIALAAERRSVDREGEDKGPEPHYVLICQESVAPSRALVAQLLDQSLAAGMSVLWLGTRRRSLPGECRSIVEIDADASRLTLTHVGTGSTVQSVSADGITPQVAEQLARALAPIRDASAQQATGELPAAVDLLDLAALNPPEPSAIVERWNRAGTSNGAPLGVGAAGSFEFDPSRDGPHALIAGTTGAGKSRLLQTMIASLAATYPPNDLSFVVIEYKGEADLKACSEVPHVLRYVTDLDGHLAERALTSLRAELARRKRVLSGHSSLEEMRRKEPLAAPARLMVVIDEFAKLVDDIPAFVDGVLDIANQGRSLGVHFVLATQRPQGIVTPAIRANTDLRIALRMSDPAESIDVIGHPDASRIPKRLAGRAFLYQDRRLTELQTAYLGREHRATQEAIVSTRPFELETDGHPPSDGVGGDETPADVPTDLTLLLDAIRRAAEIAGIAPNDPPWLEPLEPLIQLDALPARSNAIPALGVLDEPARQRQRVFEFDLEADGHVLVYGTGGSGKTTFLRTLAASLARDADVDDVEIYAIDCSTHALSSIGPLPHVGGIVYSDDPERARRLFARLARTMDERRERFAAAGASTLSEYVEATGMRLPRIVVLLDDYAGFVAAFARVDRGELIDLLPRLVAEGRPLGIHFAMTTAHHGGFPHSLTALVPLRIILRMASAGDYAMLLADAKSVAGAEFPDGRGFLVDGTELQCAVIGSDGSGQSQKAALEDLGRSLAVRLDGRRAPELATLPSALSRAALPSSSEALHATIGVEEEHLSPVTVSLAQASLAVIGPYGSGRSTALGTIARSLADSSPDHAFHLLAPRPSPLAALDLWDSSTVGHEACDEAAGRLAKALTAGDPSRPFIVVLDNGEELMNTPGGLALETIVRRGRDTGVRLIAAVERQVAAGAFGGWFGEVKRDEQALLLDPNVDVDGGVFGVRLPRRSSIEFVPGRGYLVSRGTVSLIQVAL